MTAPGFLIALLPVLWPAPPAAKSADPFTLTVTGDIEPADAPVVGRLATVFYQSYPKLVERFGHPDKPAPRRVRLVVKPTLDVPAYCTGAVVTVSRDWLRKHPDDVGLFTHELTHVVQAYPPGAPGWLVEGVADYARHKYGPADQPGWALPARLTARNKYTDAYRVTARFLVWLDDKHPGAVDKLHRKMQDRAFAVEDFKELTGKTVDELWAACVAELGKKP